jgi:hypothetical protein
VRLALALGLMLAATPALALQPSAERVTCAAAVTTGIGGVQEVRDLSPSELPVLPYGAQPGERQFKQLARIGEAPIRLFVYRVNETLLHMQVYEAVGDGKAVLADTPLVGEVSELSWGPLGGRELVTVYCY